MVKKCKYCGAEFEPHYHAQKYCTPDCFKKERKKKSALWQKQNREAFLYQLRYYRVFGRWLKIEEAREHCRRGAGGDKMVKKCEYCGAEFEPHYHAQKYCTPDCFEKGQKKRAALWQKKNREAILYQLKYQRFFGRWLKIEEARERCQQVQGDASVSVNK